VRLGVELGKDPPHRYDVVDAPDPVDGAAVDVEIVDYANWSGGLADHAVVHEDGATRFVDLRNEVHFDQMRGDLTEYVDLPHQRAGAAEVGLDADVAGEQAADSVEVAAGPGIEIPVSDVLGR
jgi:hypothetical protein